MPSNSEQRGLSTIDAYGPVFAAAVNAIASARERRENAHLDPKVVEDLIPNVSTDLLPHLAQYAYLKRSEESSAAAQIAHEWANIRNEISTSLGIDFSTTAASEVASKVKDLFPESPSSRLESHSLLLNVLVQECLDTQQGFNRLVEFTKAYADQLHSELILVVTSLEDTGTDCYPHLETVLPFLRWYFTLRNAVAVLAKAQESGQEVSLEDIHELREVEDRSVPILTDRISSFASYSTDDHERPAARSLERDLGTFIRNMTELLKQSPRHLETKATVDGLMSLVRQYGASTQTLYQAQELSQQDLFKRTAEILYFGCEYAISNSDKDTAAESGELIQEILERTLNTTGGISWSFWKGNHPAFYKEVAEKTDPWKIFMALKMCQTTGRVPHGVIAEVQSLLPQGYE